MSLLEWAAKSRHESANDPVIVAEQFAWPGAAPARVAPPHQASRATPPAARTVPFVFAQLMATSIGNGRLQFLQRRRTAGPDTGPPPGADAKAGVGFGSRVALVEAGEASMCPLYSSPITR